MVAVAGAADTKVGNDGAIAGSERDLMPGRGSAGAGATAGAVGADKTEP